jgi:hypothetical protein
MTQKSCWISSDDAVWRHVFRDNAAGAHYGVLANRNVRKDCASRADRSPFPYEGALDLPISLSLQISVGCRCSRIAVVDKGDSMADEHVVFDGDAFTDKSMARDFAASAYTCIFLNFDEGPDFCFVADFASIQIDELGEFDTLTKFDVISDTNIGVHDLQSAFPGRKNRQELISAESAAFKLLREVARVQNKGRFHTNWKRAPLQTEIPYALRQWRLDDFRWNSFLDHK